MLYLYGAIAFIIIYIILCTIYADISPSTKRSEIVIKDMLCIQLINIFCMSYIPIGTLVILPMITIINLYSLSIRYYKDDARKRKIHMYSALRELLIVNLMAWITFAGYIPLVVYNICIGYILIYTMYDSWDKHQRYNHDIQLLTIVHIIHNIAYTIILNETHGLFKSSNDEVKQSEMLITICFMIEIAQLPSWRYKFKKDLVGKISLLSIIIEILIRISIHIVLFQWVLYTTILTYEMKILSVIMVLTGLCRGIDICINDTYIFKSKLMNKIIAFIINKFNHNNTAIGTQNSIPNNTPDLATGNTKLVSDSTPYIDAGKCKLTPYSNLDNTGVGNMKLTTDSDVTAIFDIPKDE
jgi:hypothetical protein